MKSAEQFRLWRALKRGGQITGHTLKRSDQVPGGRSLRRFVEPCCLCVFVMISALTTACRQDMHDQPKYRPLRPVEQIGTINDGRSARPPVEGTVARGE